MILEGKTETLLLEEGEVSESTNMEIDADSHIFMMRMLSKFYSDNIGSPIRETASNALDSHRECGSTEPIIVSFKQNKDGNYEFSVQDFGCGLDDKDVENVIKKYGKSTKRQSVNQLGAFGLGFKSPLAYSSSFYFIGRKNGMERKWMMYESDDEENKIDLLYSSPTEERNGVKIIISVKYSDKNEFITKIKEQLAYFENVYFDCGEHIKNDSVKIIRSEHFQWSSLISDNDMHLCLDDVYYPLDFDKLGISSIYFPVGLKFSLTDGIFPVPNREQLKYTKEAKEIILKKIALVADHFVAKYNESIKDTDDVMAIIDFYQNSGRNIPHLNGNTFHTMSVQNLEKYSKVKFLSPKLNNLKFLTTKRIYEVRDYLLSEYITKYSYYGGRFNTEKERGSWRQKISIDQVKRKEIYTFSELSMLKKTYLRDILDGGRRYFVKREKSLKLGSVKSKYSGRGYEDYVSILQLHNYPKNQWREIIKEWQYIVSLVTSKFIDVDKMEITPEWIESRKKQRLQLMTSKGTNVRRKKLTGEVTGKVCERLERYVSGKNCKLVSTVFQMKDAHKDKKFIIYGGEKDESLFQQLYITVDKKKVRLVTFSERELKNLTKVDLHNWMEIGKFMEGKHKIFKRVVTAYLIHKLEKQYPQVFSRFNILQEISTSLGEKVERLSKYTDEYFTGGNEETYEAMLSVAKEHNLYDTSILDVYKEVQIILGKLTFAEPMFSLINTRYKNNEIEPILKAIRDLFKYYKQRIDWEHYNLPVNEEVVEPVIEAIVEEEVLEF